MPNLTTKELAALEDQLGVEQTLIKKYGAMSGQSADASLKTKFSSIAQRHQRHYDTLLKHLG